MAKSIKLNDDNYIDSTGVVHNKQLLENFIVVDSGNNENGSYIKYGDGTMVCYGKVTFNASTSAWGNLQVYDYKQSIPFPMAFINDDIVVTAQCNNTTYSFITGALGVEKDAIKQISIIRGNAVTNASVTVVYFAIGKWK